MRVLIVDNSAVYRRLFDKAVAEKFAGAVVDYSCGADTVFGKLNKYNYDLIIIDTETAGDNLMKLLKQITLGLPKATVLLAMLPSFADSDTIKPVSLVYGERFRMVKQVDMDYNQNVEAIKQKLGEVLGPCGHTEAPPKIETKRFSPTIILIASSTGGPHALEVVLGGLPAGFPVPVVIVQHMPEHFIPHFSRQLAGKSPLKVIIPEERETVKPGIIYLAPGGVHIGLDRRKHFFYDESRPIYGVRPAADILFRHAAENLPPSEKILVVILTGMGNDGRDGVAALKKNHACYCITQSEKTCVVYGMPRVAVEGGLSDAALDLEQIAPKIVSMVYG